MSVLAYQLGFPVQTDQGGGIALTLPQREDGVSPQPTQTQRGRGGLGGNAGAELANFLFELARPVVGEVLEDQGVIDDAAELRKVTSEMESAEAGEITPEQVLDTAGVVGEIIEDVGEVLEHGFVIPEHADIALGEIHVDEEGGKLVARVEPEGERRERIEREIMEQIQAEAEVEENALKETSTSVSTQTETSTNESEGGAPCDCPDQVDRAGRRCGGRSAVRRSGGKSPACAGSIVETVGEVFGPDAREVADRINKIVRQGLD